MIRSTAPMAPRWVSAFVDLPATAYDDTVRFWAEITGYAVSEPRGDRQEFVSLLPEGADDHLRVQRIAEGGPGIHLDLHVDDPEAAAARAVEWGATILAAPGYVVLSSPGGFVFCLVTHPATRLAEPQRWPAGHSSLVDQVCLDIPSDLHAAESRFWAELTGWQHEQGRFAEFSALTPPPTVRVRLLLQRLEERTGPVRGHLDLSTDDRAAEVSRHLAAGADLVVEHEHWAVLRDPSGADYCITDRDPISGRLPPV